MYHTTTLEQLHTISLLFFYRIKLQIQCTLGYVHVCNKSLQYYSSSSTTIMDTVQLYRSIHSNTVVTNPGINMHIHTHSHTLQWPIYVTNIHTTQTHMYTTLIQVLETRELILCGNSYMLRVYSVFTNTLILLCNGK